MLTQAVPLFAGSAKVYVWRNEQGVLVFSDSPMPGAEEVERDDGEIIIQGEVESFGDIYKKLEELGLEIEESSLERLPLNTKAATSKEVYDTVVTIVELCEDDDDVSKVYHNMDFSEEFSE